MRLNVAVPERVFAQPDQTPKEHLQKIIDENLKVILAEQDPQTGLFPASTKEHFVAEGHYDHAWVRDNAAVVRGLLAARQSLKDGPLKEQITDCVKKSIEGSLKLFGQEPWQGAFQQAIIREPEGYTHLSEEAPPTHMKIDGSECSWRQNQPDSWGAHLINVAEAHNQEIFTPDEEQRKTLFNEMKYLVNIKAEKFESSSMWEDRERYDPPPVSTALIVQEGLEQSGKMFKKIGNLSEHEHEILKLAHRRINAVGDFVRSQYPKEMTWPKSEEGQEIHQSRTDLATLVAFGWSNHERLPLSRYLQIANSELGNGDMPGKIRFVGDPYYRDKVTEKEAVWFMALPLESMIFSKEAKNARDSGNLQAFESYKRMSEKRLGRAIEIERQCGYPPELCIQKSTGLEPNNNDLLWNRALLIEAAVRYGELSSTSTLPKAA